MKANKRVETPSRLPFLLIVCVVCSILSSAHGGAPISKAQVPNELMAAVEREFPHFAVVQPDDVDQTQLGCGELQTHPGLVQGDFNGDGRTDYAALLKGLAKGHAKGKSQGSELFPLVFVVLLQEANGLFTSVVLERLKDVHPFIVGLSRMEPGLISETPAVGERTVHLANPAIMRYWCQKSAAVFYWDTRAKRFDSIATAD